MTKDELISKQQIEIEELKQEAKYKKQSFENIYNILYSVGAPLNDNILGFKKEQLTPFFRISDIISAEFSDM